ncbi:hypothetical protein COV25_02430 [candidate division WWE3 bacterium CG10_big_fil_rev_8_21_14_0_10_35_32]|nr:MAG: hypothetical protein COV25_02430 [candidate division WWE3 bacterium CG10_big_fil_rev_8_21_14_0_10_35_32]
MPKDIPNLISTSKPDYVAKRLIIVLFSVIILLGISKDPFENWTLYTNDDAGFSFKYPSAWELNGKMFISPNKSESLTVFVNTPIGFECYKRTSVENINIGQIKGTKENYQGVSSDLCGNSDSEMMTINFRLNSKVINFLYSINKDVLTVDPRNFDKIISTIEFNNPVLN